MNKVFVILAVLVGIMSGVFFIPSVTHAQDDKHYRAVFVAESDLPIKGKAEIQVNANNVAHIVIHVSGLLPGETFPAHIHEGATIDNPGNILLALPDLVANKAGVATLETNVANADALDLANRTIGIHLLNNIRIGKGAIE